MNLIIIHASLKTTKTEKQAEGYREEHEQV